MSRQSPEVNISINMCGVHVAGLIVQGFFITGKETKVEQSTT